MALFISCQKEQITAPPTSQGQITLPGAQQADPVISIVLTDNLPAHIYIGTATGDTLANLTTASYQLQVKYGVKYEVLITRDGYVDFYLAPILPLTGNLPLALSLVKESLPVGELVVQTNTPAFVYNQGYVIMVAPGKTTLAPGNYDLQFIASGYQIQTAQAVIDNNQTTNLAVNLIKQTRPVGYLTVQVEPLTGKLTLTDNNHQPVAYFTGAISNLELPIGEYQLYAEAADYVDSLITFNIEANQTTQLQLKLRPTVSEEKYQVVFNSSPSGADIYLDGFWRGKTSWQKDLSPGDYILHLQKEGYAPFDATVKIKSDTAFNFSLPPLSQSFGYLTLKANPANVQTVISGPGQYSAVLVGSVNRYMLSPGDYQLYFSAQGYQDSSLTARIKNDQETVLEINLRKIKSTINHAPQITAFQVSPTTGQAPLKIKFNATAVDADNDQLTYSWDFGNGASSTAMNGEYVFTQPGLYTVKLTVSDGQLMAQQSAAVLVSQVGQKPTLVTVQSDPSEAEVYFDNVYQGFSPVSFAADSGQHQIALVKSGYEKLDTTVTIKGGQENMFEFNLTPLPPELPAYVKITANVDSVFIFEDRARYVGMATLTSPLIYQTEPGLHFIEGYKPGYQVDYSELTAVAGDTLELNLNLTPKDNGGGSGNGQDTTGLKAWVEVDIDDGQANEITKDLSFEIRLNSSQPVFEITGKSQQALSGKLTILNRRGIIGQYDFDSTAVKFFYLNGFDWCTPYPTPIGIVFTVYDQAGKAYTDISAVLLPKKKLIVNGQGFPGDLLANWVF